MAATLARRAAPAARPARSARRSRRRLLAERHHEVRVGVDDELVEAETVPGTRDLRERLLASGTAPRRRSGGRAGPSGSTVRPASAHARSRKRDALGGTLATLLGREPAAAVGVPAVGELGREPQQRGRPGRRASAECVPQPGGARSVSSSSSSRARRAKRSKRSARSPRRPLLNLGEPVVERRAAGAEPEVEPAAARRVDRQRRARHRGGVPEGDRRHERPDARALDSERHGAEAGPRRRTRAAPAGTGCRGDRRRRRRPSPARRAASRQRVHVVRTSAPHGLVRRSGERRPNSQPSARDPLAQQPEERLGVDPDADARVRLAAGAAPEVDDACGRGRGRRRSPPRRCGGASVDEARPDDLRDGDRVVDRRAVPAVRLLVEALEELDEVGDERADPAGRAQRLARRSAVTSAWCVTSRPTIVTSIPLWKTACAASGSAQMLNSAAGVMLPSAMAPPMSTISPSRAAASGCCASSRATLVSGPVGDEDGAVHDPLGEEVDGVRADRRGRRVGEHRAVEPALAVDVRRDDELALQGRSAPAATGTSVRPGELEDAERVRGRLLERLVAEDGR